MKTEPCILIVDLSGETFDVWTEFKAIVLDPAKVRSPIKSEDSWSGDPDGVLLVGQSTADAWKEKPWIVGVPSVAIQSFAAILKAGHPTPTSKLKVKRIVSAVKRLLKKAATAPVDVCPHPEVVPMGVWVGGKKEEPVQVCSTCCGVVK